MSKKIKVKDEPKQKEVAEGLAEALSQEAEEAVGAPVETVEQAAAADTVGLEQRLAESEARAREFEDRHLRLAAEFDNYKKRIQREQEILFKYAQEGILKELLPSLDNLERAVSQANADADAGKLLEGVRLTLKGLQTVLEKFGLQAVSSVGQPFNPNLHEAVAMEASAEVPAQHVLREYERGYQYKDRLLRAAKVVVAAGSGS